MKAGGHIRIIGGQWKSRRLRLTATAALRPSPDAVRETLFNWLPHRLDGVRCLDLFAGSGAFGFEAASRGAAQVVMVESNRQTVHRLRDNREKLQAGAIVEIVASAVEEFLRRRDDAFDIVFLDPPFARRMIEATCGHLQNRGFLRAGACVYIESPTIDNPLPLPVNWHIMRQKQCGRVQSTLLTTHRQT